MLLNFALEDDSLDAYYYWTADVNLNRKGDAVGYQMIGQVRCSYFDDSEPDKFQELTTLPENVMLRIEQKTMSYQY